MNIMDFTQSTPLNNHKIKFLKMGIFLFPLIFIFLIILNKILFGPMNDFYVNFAKEDGPVEYSTAIFYFLSFVFSVIIGSMFYKQKKYLFALLYLLFSAIFFFIAFEEISWGQRIFLFETPEYFAENLQNETNFHNLPIISNYRQYLLVLVSFGVFILWAVFTHYDKLKDRSFTKFFVPKGFMISYFIPVFLFLGMYFFQNRIPTSPEGLLFYIFHRLDYEVNEFILSAGIFIFILSKFIILKNQKRITKLEGWFQL